MHHTNTAVSQKKKQFYIQAIDILNNYHIYIQKLLSQMQHLDVQNRRASRMLWSHSEAATTDNSQFQNLFKSSMIAMVVLCPKMKAPTTMVMIPQTVKITLQMKEVE